jgi:hypothetical protein
LEKGERKKQKDWRLKTEGKEEGKRKGPRSQGFKGARGKIKGARYVVCGSRGKD